ncbi:hypothetical protein Aple_037250 [Acrocarpospora pleiomorpha]|uniref:SEFIR domain-containing protein n=1 Tax=Acrocarpospora pleiomorpha TaxID=90975 RepID=A0A5M3XKY3_9ACTN|nr:toll/interleukin-1 receptor domain-containing protein [Acrocarpospora pleiomorpha]GES20829.1 hypothetical protein Aple_037250 [Acrocarpospora pleiomorpha]
MDLQSDQDLIGDIPLYLTPASKSVESAPNKIALGLIKLRKWQVHRLAPLAAGFDRQDAYLVRVNYEFDIAPDVPPPLWAEVQFEFMLEEVTVVDAMPRAVTAPAAASSWTLTGELQFARRDGDGHGWPAGSPAAAIALPAISPDIECFGVGGELVRWRHTGKVPPGTHTGVFALLVPAQHDTLPVTAEGTYYVRTPPDLQLRPTGRRDAFDVPLRSRHRATGTSPAKDAGSRGRGPRVFVSYAQESRAHKDAVRDLCTLLLDQGLDVHYDQQGLDKRRNWDRWINTQIQRAHYVIVVASPAYREAGDGSLPEGVRLGVRFEYARLADLLHRFPDEWTEKILPVVLPGRSHEEIPLSFLPGLADYYPVTDMTEQGARKLLRVLLRQADTS